MTTSLSPELTAIDNCIVELRHQLEALPSAKRLPDGAVGHIYSMACNLLRQGKNEGALGYFRVLTLYRPTEARYLAGLAVCSQVLGNYDQAIMNFAFAAHVEPGNPEYMLAIAECELLQKNYVQAHQSLDIVVQYCKESGRFDQTRLRAEGMLVLIQEGDRSAAT
jgi:type III secretion system low calcium response chaperone LcrH/SycD